MELIGLMCGSFCALFTTVYSFSFVRNEYSKDMTLSDYIFTFICFLSSIGLMTYLIYMQQ